MICFNRGHLTEDSMNSLTPSQKSRFPTIDTDVADFSFSLESPSSAPPNEIPSFYVSNLSENSPISPSSPQRPRKPKSNIRARTESRKLLAHILGQMERRNMPPPVFDAFEATEDQSSGNNLGALMETVKDAVRTKSKKRDIRSNPQAGLVEEDSDDEGERGFSPDVTYDLMAQLKDLLIMSVAQGWHIFDDGSSTQQFDDSEAGGKLSSPFRRSRNSLQPGGRRSRSPSPSHGRQIRAPELLSLCISVLASVVLEDCRYKIASPRPSRPPNALQALTLDVAQFLLHIHCHDPNIISKIGFAMIPAFSTFQPEMHGRLLNFFETAVIRGILDDLRQIQGVDDILPNKGQTEEPSHNGVMNSPIVSIRIDAVQENLPGMAHPHWVPWSSPPSALKLHSTYAPFQSLPLYFLSSLVAPLLATILECVDLSPESSLRFDHFHRFSQLLRLIVDKKIDAYSDILQVVAYHAPKSRRYAINILLALWPQAVGHIVVSRPFAEFYNLEQIRVGSLQVAEHLQSHQFVPWRFVSKQERSHLNGFSHYDCRSCTNPICGFGLLCPFCMCAVHFECYDYPEGSFLLQYALASEPNVQRVAMYRFSDIIPNPRSLGPGLIRRHRHTFRPVNLFTLCLCFICRKPLWGCTSQGLNCASCMHFTHSSCLILASELPPCSPANLTSDDMNIDWADLRHTCVDFHREILHLSFEELGRRSYEEISIFYAAMWTQLQIITSGIALGSIVVMQNGRNAAHAKEHRLDEFELHRVIKWCEAHLSSNRLPCSDAMDDYLAENQLARSKHSMMFDWSNLVYICSAAKAPHTPQQFSQGSSADLLNVAQPDAFLNHPDVSSQPFEVVPIAHMRDVLGYEFHIESDIAARIVLAHLNHLGLFEQPDGNPVLFNDANLKTAYSIFPLPLGLDLSTNVETLVSAVEACLSDLDLSVNEVGFLLLLRRFWPSGLASDYALRRITRNLLSWILAEDDNLAIILRDYLANHKSLPGVRSARDIPTWPSSHSSRPVPSSSVNNGGDYVAARRTLLARYAIPWLLALHDQDAANYVDLVFDACLEMASPSSRMAGTLSGITDAVQLLNQSDNILRAITRLSQASVAFSTFDDLFLRWLESVSMSGVYEEPTSSLSRLFPRETEASHRYSVGLDQAISQTDNAIIDPWRIVLRIASQDMEGLSRGLQWLYHFARSNVEIPLTTFKKFSALVTEFDSSLTDSLLLAKSVLSSTWLKSMGRQQLQSLFSELHGRLAPRIVEYLRGGTQVNESIAFIRISLGTCLLLYGCDRSKLNDLNMITESDIKGLPSRRKMNVRGSVVVDPMIVDPRLMDALELYMAVNSDDILCLVAKFLNLFLTDSPYLEPYEVDNFILRNGRLLATCAWQFYDIQRHEISGIRTNLLLRTLVVDSEPFQDILHTWFLPTSSWERRLRAVTRLFRIILDVTSPAFSVEDRQWQSSIVDIFYYFFSAMWSDEREEIRVAVETFSASLLPAHFGAISACWSESISKTPIKERIRLISFLIQLRPHFPTWKVLSWEAAIEALLEESYGDMEAYNEDTPVAARLSIYGLSSPGINVPGPRADPEMATLRASILLLTLQMVADGIVIDSYTLLKLKVHLVQVVGFNEVSVVPSSNGHSFHVQFGEVNEIPEVALPCVNQLLPVLDAYHPVDLSPSVMAGANVQDERQVSLLVGSIFVDMFLGMFCTVSDLSALPVLTSKSMLETLCVVIYKHDFESRVLRHLQQTLRRAVLRSLEILSEDISYDLRQLALSVIQGFIKRWHSFMGSIIYTSIESVAKLVASQHHHGQDVLVTQAKSFLDTTLTTYAQNGLFTNLLKRNLDSEFFAVLKQVTDANMKSNPTSPQCLRELLLRDVLGRIVEVDQATFQIMLKNVQTYVDVIFHHGYSIDLMLFVGQQMTQISRRISEWAPDVVDPAPLILIFATLIQQNKANSRGMISSIDTVVRVLLNRSNVNTASLSKLLQVTATLYRRTQAAESTLPPDNIVLLVFELLAEGLRLKTRILPSTLKSMLEAIIATEIPGSLPPLIKHLPSFLGLVDPGIHFLQAHTWLDVGSENDFSASLAVAKILLQIAGQDPSVMIKLSDHGTERSAHTNLRVRAWNMLVLAALLEPKENWTTTLLAQLSSFSYAHHAAIRVYSQSGTSPPESSTVDINHAYIAIKLWILLAQKVTAHGNGGDARVFGVWNELWPPFEGLVNAFEAEASSSQSLILGPLVISSMADLFVFLRTLHTPITLHTSTHIATLNRLRNLGHGEIATGKLIRALKLMSESPPETPYEVLVNQAAKDVVAAEKLRAIEARVVQERRAPERYRRDMRATT